MSNLRDSISERNIDVSRPSTSQVPAPQSLRSKSSHNNKMKDKISSKISTSHSATERQKHHQNESTTTTRVFRNSSVSDVSAQCQNISINSESDDVDPSNNPSNPRKKNAKKREKLKALKITPSPSNTQQHFVPNMHQPSPQVSTGNMTPIMPFVSAAPHLVLQNPAGYMVSPQAASAHEFFFSQLNPMYMNSTSRYMENLCYHPQYQYSQQMREMVHRQAVSMPSTPMVPRLQRPHSGSIPNSPECNNTPRHLQNILQHPLLRQSFSRENQTHNLFLRQNSTPKSPASAENGDSKSPRRRKKKTNDASLDEKKFDPYMSAEEVEKGLRDDTLLEGVLRINPKQFLLAYVSSSDRTEQDLLIEGMKNRNRGLEGDVVVVQYIVDIEPDENYKQKKGKVVFIKEKVHTRTCIGVLKLMPDRNRQRALFVPRDHRIPRLNIPFSSWPDNFYKDAKGYENTLFLAKIVEWADTRFAIGNILCNIGQSGDMMSETKAILAQTDLDITPFGPELRDLYPRLDYVIPEEEIKLREDCRRLCLFSIDPANCRDIDDAVSCRKLSNGNFEIGVHISDVAHFLTENTLLDEKVADKATTIYLVERAYHMLPDDLCMLCSLFPGVDKLAFSVFWEITKDAKVLSHRFSKTVIHSCCQLAYEHAQAILDDDENSESDFPETYNGFQYKDIHETIKILGSLSRIMRKNRFDGGALRIDQPKVTFRLNPENGLPSSFTIYGSKESHQLIEEFMLLANMTVAARIEEDHPKLAFLRCHPPPSAYMLQQLAKSLKPMGIDLNIDSAGNLHHSLLPYTESETERGRAMVLNMLCAKPMARAKYFCAGGCEDGDYHHYALNVPIYTHFTSPIRRYADIMVHRLLAASLKFRDTPKWEVDKVRLVAAQCNKQKYNAKKAGELSTELYTLKYIELNSPVKTEAVVVDVREKYIDVIIVVMGLNRRIFFNNDFPGEYKCIKNEAGAKLSKMILTWRAGDDAPQVEQVIEVFSILKVEMIKGDDMVKVETRLVRPL